MSRIAHEKMSHVAYEYVMSHWHIRTSHATYERVMSHKKANHITPVELNTSQVRQQHDSLLRVTRLVHMCEMTHLISATRHDHDDSFDMCNTTHKYVFDSINKYGITRRMG